MDLKLLKEFEDAFLSRNPSIAGALQPGLPRADIQRALKRGKVTGDSNLLFTIYTWRDGVLLHAGTELMREQKGFFPGETYYFLCLEMALAHFGSHKEVAASKPKVAEAVGRYFPIFWNGSVSWLAVDLMCGNQNRVMLVQLRDDEPLREAYGSFDDFVRDGIRAGRENAPLRCFGSKAVVEAHGGTIRVTSQLGHGSVFSFTLPLKTAHVAS